jgi:hypothetical protein
MRKPSFAEWGQRPAFGLTMLALSVAVSRVNYSPYGVAP